MTAQLIAMLGAVLLLLTVVVGFVRVMAGPTAADRMASIQLFGTTGVGIALLLSHAFEDGAFVDVALVIALLAAITSIAFVRHYHASLLREDDDDGA